MEIIIFITWATMQIDRNRDDHVCIHYKQSVRTSDLFSRHEGGMYTEKIFLVCMGLIKS